MNQTKWTLAEELLTHSIAAMRPHGMRGNEGLVLWFSRSGEQDVRITHAVELFGPGFTTAPLFMSLSMRAMAVLTDFAEKHGVFLAGQIHSHPGAFLDLSELDMAHGIRSQNYLSVVCPYYAQRDITGLKECGVHIFDRTRYRRFDTHEIERRIHVSRTPLLIYRLEVSN